MTTTRSDADDLAEFGPHGRQSEVLAEHRALPTDSGVPAA